MKYVLGRAVTEREKLQFIDEEFVFYSHVDTKCFSGFLWLPNIVNAEVFDTVEDAQRVIRQEADRPNQIEDWGCCDYESLEAYDSLADEFDEMPAIPTIKIIPIELTSIKR